MKRFLAACVLCTGLVGLVGCKQTASEPAAQGPATDSADRQEVMKPTMEDSTGDETNATETADAPSAAQEPPEAAKP